MKDIIKTTMKNLIGVPLFQAQSQMAGQLPIGAARSVVNVGITAQAAGLLGENLKYTKKKFKGLKL